MSSLKNKLIKLAYEKPHLRKGLLPLIIKKYATLNAQVFDAIASTLCKSAGMVDEDNNIIIKDLVKKTHPLISKTAYFFYNFAYRTFESDKVFILC